MCPRSPLKLTRAPENTELVQQRLDFVPLVGEGKRFNGCFKKKKTKIVYN
jgi:hypothetical protein